MTRSAASIRRIGVSFFLVLLAAMLYGMSPADSSPQGARPTPTSTQTGPKPSPQHTVRPRQPTTSPRPTATDTDPYPGGAAVPGALDADAFFRVSDTVPSESGGGQTMLWIGLAIAAVGLTLRWFFVISRIDREP